MIKRVNCNEVLYLCQINIGWLTLFCPTDEAFNNEPFMPGDDTLIEKMRLTVARG